MELVTVVRHLNPASAELDAARLEAAGFSVLKNGEFNALTGGGGTIGEILIQVPENQAEAAKELLNAEPVDASPEEPEDQGS